MSITLDQAYHIGRKIEGRSMTASVGSPGYIDYDEFATADSDFLMQRPINVVHQMADGTPVELTPTWELNGGAPRLKYTVSFTNYTIIIQ